MKVLNIPFSTWIQVAQNNALSTFHRLDGLNSAMAWCGSSELIYRTSVGALDFLAWSTAFPASTAVLGEDDAIAHIVGLNTTTIVTTTAPTFEDTRGIYPKWQGNLYTTIPGATNFFDEVVSTEKQLRGGWYEVVEGSVVVGDYIESSVVDKDNVLGLFGAYGLTPGVDVLELKKYVKKEYLNPVTASERQVFIAKSTFVVMAGLYIRTAYQSVGTTPIKLKVTTLTYE